MVSGWKQAQLAYFPEDVEHGLCAPVLCRWNIYRFSTSAAKLAGHLESNLCKKAPVHGADRYQGWLTRDSLPTPLRGCHYGVYQTPDQSQLSRGQLLYGVRRREQYQKNNATSRKKNKTPRPPPFLACAAPSAGLERKKTIVRQNGYLVSSGLFRCFLHRCIEMHIPKLPCSSEKAYHSLGLRNDHN